MSLDVAVKHRFGDFLLDVGFSATSGVTALFGRSGSGKTTVVNVIAGLIRPMAGRVAVDGAVLLDTAAGVFQPAHRRRVGYVFQEGRLFPHLTVRQNLLYGRLFAPRGDGAAPLEHVVELLGIGHLLGRRPAGLSGGEKQRVAIGRALLARPRLLLLDEPLAALDEPRKAEILPYLERLRDETRVPIVYVTHAVPEVVRLATTLVVLAEGRVAATGPLAEVMARFDVGTAAGPEQAGAVLEATVRGYDATDRLTALETPAGTLHVPGRVGAQGARLRVHVHARDVMLALHRPTAMSALNVLPGTVAEIGARDGAVVDVRLDCAGVPLLARLTRRSVTTLDLAPGRPLFAVIKSIALAGDGSGPPTRIDLG